MPQCVIQETIMHHIINIRYVFLGKENVVLHHMSHWFGQKSSDHLCNDIPLPNSFPAQGTALQKMKYRQQPDTPAVRGSALDRKQETE